MYKVLLADDEPCILGLLRNCIDWQEYSMQIVAQATSTLQAVELCRCHLPDILITDINMGAVSGLELAALVRRESMVSHVILLTGYNEFEFAQKAIRIGVADYILKPIDEDYLLRRLLVIQEKLRIQSALSDEEEGRQKLLRKNALSSLVDMAVQYVGLNLDDKGLSLEKTANALFVNYHHLSRAFKQEMGMNFIDFVMEERIKEACRLLGETDMKAYQIADAIGISERHYFSTFFRRQTGMTVQEYRRCLEQP